MQSTAGVGKSVLFGSFPRNLCDGDGMCVVTEWQQEQHANILHTQVDNKWNNSVTLSFDQI